MPLCPTHEVLLNNLSTLGIHQKLHSQVAKPWAQPNSRKIRNPRDDGCPSHLPSPVIDVLEQADGQVLRHAPHTEVGSMHACTCTVSSGNTWVWNWELTHEMMWRPSLPCPHFFAAFLLPHDVAFTAGSERNSPSAAGIQGGASWEAGKTAWPLIDVAAAAEPCLPSPACSVPLSQPSPPLHLTLNLNLSLALRLLALNNPAHFEFDACSAGYTEDPTPTHGQHTQQRTQFTHTAHLKKTMLPT